jgi:hypothetical protein
MYVVIAMKVLLPREMKVIYYIAQVQEAFKANIIYSMGAFETETDAWEFLARNEKG